MKKENEKTEVNLSELQFKLILANIEKINYLNEKLKDTEQHQNNILSLVCSENDIEYKGNAQIDIQNKKLILQNDPGNQSNNK